VSQYRQYLILLIETMEAAPNMTAHFDVKQAVSFFSCLDIIIVNFFLSK
jgi:hypothetical protein